MPLWGNPPLLQPNNSSLGQQFADLPASTIEQFLSSTPPTSTSSTAPPNSATPLSGSSFGPAAAGFFLDLQLTREQVAALLQHLSAGWTVVAWRHLGSSPSETAAVSHLLPCLGCGPPDAQPLPFSHFLVRLGT